MQIINTIDLDFFGSYSPIIEQELPEHRRIDLLQLTVKFQLGKLELKEQLKSLTTDFQPTAIPHAKHGTFIGCHTSNIKSLAFVPGTSTLLSGSSDKKKILSGAMRCFRMCQN